MTKIERFLRGFSVVHFSAISSFDLLKTSKDSTPKITVPVSGTVITGKAMHFNGLISKHQGRNAKKKITTLRLFISAMSHVTLIAETRVYICHKNMKSLGIFFTVFRKFSWKSI